MELWLQREDLQYYNQDIIAQAGVGVLYDSSHKDNLKHLKNIQQELIDKHPHNVVLKNATDFFLNNLSDINPSFVKDKKDAITKKLSNVNTEIAKIAAKKIPSGGSIFIHSINNHLFEILIQTAKYKKFQLNLVNHSQKDMGTKLVEKLRHQGISVSLYPDLLITDAITNADVCFLGAIALSHKFGPITKLGGKLSADLADKHNVPIYACAHTWKYDKHNTFNFDNSHHPTRKFERIAPTQITGYILEHGIYKHEFLKRELDFHINKFI